ncbi:Oxidoreductase, variant 2 [Aspergillus wentii]
MKPDANNDIYTVSFRSQNQTESVDESSLPTLESVKSKIREREQKVAAPKAPETEVQPAADEQAQLSIESGEGAVKSPQELEEEAGQEAAFNPETGEINWDCPCLGGMAHGPCGEDFKAAFSCFVFSEDEPKGIDCIDKFKAMQDCFRQHPEIYGAELEDDEAPPAPEGQQAIEEPAPAAQTEAASNPETTAIPKESHDTESKNEAPKSS